MEALPHLHGGTRRGNIHRRARGAIPSLLVQEQWLHPEEDRMFEPRASSSSAPIAATRYGGPERRTAAASMSWRWLAATLDEVDYGLLLLDEHAQVLHINQAARAELDAEHSLQILGQSLRARHPRDVGPLHAALDAAVRRGLRKLLTLGEKGAQVGISVVPLGALGHDGRTATLVMLGKRRVGSEFAVLAFARNHGAASETRVLQACATDCGRRSPPRNTVSRSRRCARRSAASAARRGWGASASWCSGWQRCRR